jgi:hypothetical protein
MLPIYRLSACSACGQSDQGTRAKAGNSVKCVGCHTMRRVPMNRPENGPDDPRAIMPARGRPFEQGNPYRIGADQPAAASKPAPTFVRRVQQTASRPAAPAASVRRPAAPEPSRRDLGTSPRQPAATGHQVVPYEQHKDWPEFDPYRPCEQCAEEHMKTSEGLLPPAVAEVGAWQNDESKGQGTVCLWHLKYFAEMVKGNPTFRIVVLKRQPKTPAKPTYTNPSVCKHLEYEYDNTNQVTRCLDCRKTWPYPTT